MHIEYESDRFEFLYDSLYGVTRWRRKADDALTYLNTGSDAQQERRDLRRLAQKTSSPRYPKGAPTFAELFDSLAGEQTFYTEDSWP